MNYRIPDVCCNCCAKNPSNYSIIKAKNSYSSAAFEITHYNFEINLKICNECSNKEAKFKAKWALIAIIGVLSVIAFVGFLTFLLVSKNEGLYYIPAVVGMMLLYFSYTVFSYIFGVKMNSFAGYWISNELLKLNNKNFVDIFLNLNLEFTKIDDYTISLKRKQSTLAVFYNR